MPSLGVGGGSDVVRGEKSTPICVCPVDEGRFIAERVALSCRLWSGSFRETYITRGVGPLGLGKDMTTRAREV